MLNGGGQLEHAVLRVEGGPQAPADGGAPVGELRFMYTPAEISTSKAANWNRPPARGARSSSKPEYHGAGPQGVQMEIWFDAWDDPEADITTSVKSLLNWTKPTKASMDRHVPQPPILRFEWGASRIFQDLRCFLKSVSAKYVLFKPDGSPIRASCTISLEEVPEDTPAQNPTSGSRESRRSVVLDDGDSLAGIAYREYGDPNLWRGIAAFNEIDDPLRMAAGTRVLVPSVVEAKQLSAREP